MYIGDWDLSMDNSVVFAVTKSKEEWRILIRNGNILIKYRNDTKVVIPSEHRNLPQLFAEYLSDNPESRKKIKKELTILKKIGKLYRIDVT